jgi:hypothetical protein
MEAVADRSPAWHGIGALTTRRWPALLWMCRTALMLKVATLLGLLVLALATACASARPSAQPPVIAEWLRRVQAYVTDAEEGSS